MENAFERAFPSVDGYRGRLSANGGGQRRGKGLLVESDNAEDQRQKDALANRPLINRSSIFEDRRDSFTAADLPPRPRNDKSRINYEHAKDGRDRSRLRVRAGIRRSTNPIPLERVT